MRLNLAAVAVLSLASSGLSAPAEELSERQIPGPGAGLNCGGTTTTLTGDGNPHQNFYHIQVTDNINCGDGDCTMTEIDSHTVTWGVDVGVVANFITGGFSVSESFTSGESKSCNGADGQTICIWASVAHTAYTVHDVDRNTWDYCDHRGPDRVIKAPNAGFEGSRYYCVRDACRSSGQGYWNKSYTPKGLAGPNDG